MKTPVPSQDAERETAMENSPITRIQNPKFPQAGFTLLEILVASGVLALMVTILFALFAEGSNAWRMGEKTAEMNQGIRTAMELIIREASMAVIDTNAPPQNLGGLSVVINKNSAGDQPASDPTPLGVYEELCFVAPVEIGNGTTNNAAVTGYRRFCGVRYYVAKAVDDSGKGSVLGNLTRVVYKTYTRGSPSIFYNNPWNPGGGVTADSAVIAENVLSFRVQPAQNDPTGQGLKPRNADMFKDMNSDQNVTINYNNFSGKTICYPGLYVGLCVVDSRTANRINEMGLNSASKMAGFYAPTNWTMVRFENFKP